METSHSGRLHLSVEQEYNIVGSNPIVSADYYNLSMKLKKCWRVTVNVYEWTEIVDGLAIDYDRDPLESEILTVVQTVKDKEPKNMKRYMEVYVKEMYKVED